MKKIAFIAALVSLAAFSACDYNDTNETGTAADGIIASVVAAPAITVYYKANVQWISSPSAINIHFNAGSGWTTVPGKAMIKHTGQYDQWVGYASYTVEGASSLSFCFNRDGAEWDNNGGKDYRVSGKGTYVIDNGTITKID